MYARVGWLLAVVLAGLMSACSTPAQPDVVDAAVPDGDAGSVDVVAPRCTYDGGVDDVPTPDVHTPRWAFEPWISKDISSTDDTYAFVEGFRSRDIPVGVVVLDSPWETNYNTFIPNPTRYPRFSTLVSDMHARNVRVVLWMTQLINRVSFDGEVGGDTYPGPAPNFSDALGCNFGVNGGAIWTWWKGQGLSLDFFNPRAVAWWHRQQDPIYELQIDGWKLDFGDAYVRGEMVQTAAGPVPHQRYSEEYYRDFFAYGVTRRGRDNFITMSRPWDESYGIPGRFYARAEHAPVAWVGDQRRDWFGQSDALDHLFRSARGGYPMIGSDVGGYLDFDDLNMFGPRIPFDTLVFARWTAWSAFMPLFQLHGRANIAPWTVSDHVDETVRLYRFWSKLHHELVPFFYSLTMEARRGGPMPIEPVGAIERWRGDYRFVLGRAFLVAPILDATGTRDVELPADARWFDFWNPASASQPGGTTLRGVDPGSRERIPVYLREGSIVTAHIADDVTALGNRASMGRLTLLLHAGSARVTFAHHDDDDVVAQIALERVGSGIRVEVSRSVRALLLRVRTDAAITSVRHGAALLPPSATRAAFDAGESTWFDDRANRTTWVRVPSSMTATVVDLQ